MDQSRRIHKTAVLRGLLCAGGLLAVLQVPAQAESLLTHHVRPAVVSGEAKLIGPLPATQQMRLDVVLPLSDRAGLEKFLQDVYNPSSPIYRHFVTVPEFTARFGPSQTDYDAVKQYAKSNGFQLVGGTRDGMELQIEGTVAQVEAAFNIRMGIYQHPTENRKFFAPDREPTTTLPFPLWHVTGLDNYSIPHSMLKRRPASVQPNTTTGSCPSSSYCGSDMRAAYYGGSLTGTGQSVGLLEYFGFDIDDVNTYFTNANQTNNVPIDGVSTDGTSLTCLDSAGCDDTEQTIDITQAVSMAPGLDAVYVFVGNSSPLDDTAIFSAMSTQLPLVAQLSSSWTWTPADPSTDDPYFMKFAAQGQNLFQAAGDSAKYTSSSTHVYPADDDYVTSVGGTDLATSGPGGTWVSETAWANGGGGYYTVDAMPIPSWQQTPGVITTANKGSTTLRNSPDVAGEANYDFYVCADQTTCTANNYGGTSFAAPMWAAYLALVNEQAVANGNLPLGFINPAIYSFGLGSGYATDFHDITSGSNGYSAIVGYDLATGWGSMNGTGLITALAGAAAPSFTITASPAALTVWQGNSGTSTITTTVFGGFNSAIDFTASGQPAGVTLSLSPTSIAAPGAGTSALTISALSTTATGSYPITITGMGGGLTQSVTVALTITVPPPPNFTISAAPKAPYVLQGYTGKVTVTTAISGPFSSAIALSASGQPTGVTVSFSPSSIAAPGSGTSTMSLAVTSAAATGAYPILITGTGGGIAQSTTVTLNVTAPGTGSFTVSSSASTIVVIHGFGASTATITTAVSGGFAAPITLKATGKPAGVTVAFTPKYIAAPGSGTATMKITAAKTAKSGTYTLTIKGSGGGETNSTTVSLVVFKF